MGMAISRLIGERDDCQIVAGIDVNTTSIAPFPVYGSISEFCGKANVIVDFSHHSALPSLVEYAIDTNTPLVICTTGHTEEELALMRSATEKVAVFFSGNMSIGINLLTELCRQAVRSLGCDFDIEIVEKHHNKKLDAPSGTALMIANALSEERENMEYVYDRHNERRQRSQNEIGIHSVRGGTIVGEHEVMFAGNNEIITISHTATSREVFAAGAIRAALYVSDKGAGMYDMSNVINEK
jgi:4-hydroxy-tetrahydrodipicolinate reductase